MFKWLKSLLGGYKTRINDNIMDAATFKGWIGIPFIGAISNIVYTNNAQATTMDYVHGEDGWLSILTEQASGIPSGLYHFSAAVITDYGKFITNNSPAVQSAFVSASMNPATALTLAPVATALVPAFAAVAAWWGVNRIHNYITTSAPALAK